MSRCHQRHLNGRHTLHDLTCTLACLELVERYLTEKYIITVRVFAYWIISLFQNKDARIIFAFFYPDQYYVTFCEVYYFLSISRVFAFSWTYISLPIYNIFALHISSFLSPLGPLHTASVSPSPLLQGKCDSLSLSQSKMTAEAKCLIDNRVNQLVNVMSFIMLFSWILQAYKQGMYGPKYVWVLISGRNQANWWKQQSHLGDCTPEQVRKGLSNNIGTGELKLSPLPGPTICGRVPINPSSYLRHSDASVIVKEMFLKCVREMNWGNDPHSCWTISVIAWKFSCVFNGIRTHDLCKCEDHFFRSSRNHTFLSLIIRLTGTHKANKLT